MRSTSAPAIYVLIPAFDEAAHLARLLPAIPKRIMGRTVGVVVVCDGSTDGTCGVGESHGAEVIKLRQNRGKGVAVRTGADHLSGRDHEVVVTMDGDGQHRPAELSSLLRPVLVDECDISIGSRYLCQPGRGATPLNRYLVRTIFTRVLQHRLAQPVTDPFSGFRAMSRLAFETVLLSGDRYEGELEVRFEAERNGLRVLEVPIERIYGSGQSKMAVTGGRLRVIRGYARTVQQKTRELDAARSRVRVA
jgi:glycosyltransferase involved in cell wall biosynthesis